MKKYKFRLEAILKIRKMKEEQCKLAIGKIQVQINQIKDEIALHHSGIDKSYESHEKGLDSGIIGRELHFHPFFVQGKKAHISRLEEYQAKLQNDVEEKYKELNQLRADVKVMEKLKEKEKKLYIKKIEKKQYEELEEQIQNWRSFVK